eukprot:scaffold200901_cov35-Tisochrysis_lutea.AAC.2
MTPHTAAVAPRNVEECTGMQPRTAIRAQQHYEIYAAEQNVKQPLAQKTMTLGTQPISAAMHAGRRSARLMCASFGH